MDVLEAIHTRRSIRKYENRPVPNEIIKEILAAAMSAPSSGNAQPWQFIVITEREILDNVPEINSKASMAKFAPMAIMVCGDLGLEKQPGRWIMDCSAATQNLLLAAHAKGIGAVWTCIYPEITAIEEFRVLAHLPEHVIPLALVVMGYPAQKLPRIDRYDEDKVHFNRWENEDKMQ